MSDFWRDQGLFQHVKASSNESNRITYSIYVPYIENYNERDKDLLTYRTNPLTYLNIRKSEFDGVYVQNPTDEPVKSYDDILHLEKMGDINRTTASTKMNDISSRSHAPSAPPAPKPFSPSP
ncbi:unnamed protein product [Zymoseptoria tritici ST99CH_1E4]|uniref:Kinesin motor domain-containing protein n=1 Tax=Zymoseptoria tritici ST99CH_1E4 TaxID=1276532 RepID=A0A2H1HBU6_ZYMTR|nr:unnamed protein product [Zymoseptoria tritici ST99CH_1E4]